MRRELLVWTAPLFGEGLGLLFLLYSEYRCKVDILALQGVMRGEGVAMKTRSAAGESMMRWGARFAMVFACVVLILCVTSCASESEPENSSAEPQREPAANIDPRDINVGILQDDDRTSDVWYVDGDQSKGGVFFTRAANDAGRTVTWVDESGDELPDNGWYMEVTDNHLKSDDSGQSRSCDFVFYDEMTCYDAVDGLWYIRGDRTIDEYRALFAGKTFVDSTDDAWYLEFEADGTGTKHASGKAYAVVWDVTSTNVLDLT